MNLSSPKKPRNCGAFLFLILVKLHSKIGKNSHLIQAMLIKLVSALVVMVSTVSPALSSSIRVLSDCNAALDSQPVYTVLNGNRNTLGGWSHVEKAKPNNEFQSLQLSDSDYQITKDNFTPEASCDGTLVQHAILVVKLSDWTRQHSNGIETILDSNTVHFGDVTHVMMDMRVNSKGTHIVNLDSLLERYKAYLPQDKFAEFDQGKVNLGITLFEDGALD